MGSFMARWKNKYIATLLGLAMMITGCGNESSSEEVMSSNDDVALAATLSSEEEPVTQTANTLNTDIIKSETDSISNDYDISEDRNSQVSSIGNQLNKDLENEREYVPDCDSGDAGYNPEHYELNLEQIFNEYGYTNCDTFKKDLVSKSIDVFKYGYSTNPDIVISPYSVINSLSVVLLGITDNNEYAGKTIMTNWFENGANNNPNYIFCGIKELNLKFMSQYEFVFDGQFVSEFDLKNKSVLSKYNTEYVSYNDGEDPYEYVNSTAQDRTGHIIFCGDPTIDNTALLSIGYFEDSWVDEADWYISDHEFINGDGTSAFPYMSLFNESMDYIETESAYGVIKPFSHAEDYSMVFVIPKQGNLDSYITTLGVDEFYALMESRSNMDVSLMVPSFTSTSEIELNGFMDNEGMGGVLGKDASYYAFTSDDMEIREILHKTYFSLNGRGARSYDDITYTYSENDVQMEGNTIICDRPFIYIVIDNDTNIPVIMGAVSNL